MDSSRASSSIQLVQLSNIQQQDVELADQPKHRPIAAEGVLTEDIGEELPPRPDASPVPESSAKAWLSVAGAFCYLFPTYGKRERTSLRGNNAC